MWVAHHVIKQHRGKEIDDAACGLHTASSSPSLSPFPLLPTLITLLQPSHLVVVVFHVVAGAGCWKVVCQGVKGYGGVGTDEGQDAQDASLI